MFWYSKHFLALNTSVTILKYHFYASKAAGFFILYSINGFLGFDSLILWFFMETAATYYVLGISDAFCLIFYTYRTKTIHYFKFTFSCVLKL